MVSTDANDANTSRTQVQHTTSNYVIIFTLTVEVAKVAFTFKNPTGIRTVSIKCICADDVTNLCEFLYEK